MEVAPQWADTLLLITPHKPKHGGPLPGANVASYHLVVAREEGCCGRLLPCSTGRRSRSVQTSWWWPSQTGWSWCLHSRRPDNHSTTERQQEQWVTGGKNIPDNHSTTEKQQEQLVRGGRFRHIQIITQVQKDIKSSGWEEVQTKDGHD